MIISHGRQYIFVHAPKTGGTSLSLALEARAKADDVMLGDTPKAKKRRHRVEGITSSGRLWKHSGLRDIYGLITPEQVASYFTFTLVRNPWDRIVSYYHWLMLQNFDHPAVGRAKALTFSEFLCDQLIQDSLRSSPYLSYVTDRDGNERCDLFIRLEHLHDDIAPLEAHLGFKLKDIPHENASHRDADYRGYYQDGAEDIVADLCAQDIARFSYTF